MDVASERYRANCRKEWENVNDPPCHPADPDWRPCKLCKIESTDEAWDERRLGADERFAVPYPPK